MNKNLRNKLAGYEPAYNPQHWEQLSQRLAEANKRRSYWQYAIAASITLLLGVGIGMFVSEKNSHLITNFVTKDTLQTSIASQINKENKPLSNNLHSHKAQNENKKGIQIAKTEIEILPKITQQNQKNSKQIFKHTQIFRAKTTIAKQTNRVEGDFTKPNTPIQSLNNATDLQKIPTNTTNKAEERLLLTELKGLQAMALLPKDTTKVRMAYYQAKHTEGKFSKTKLPFRIGIAALPMQSRWTNKNSAEATKGMILPIALLVEWRIKNFVVGTGLMVSSYTVESPKEQSLSLVIDSTYKLNTYLYAQQQLQELIIPISLRYDWQRGEKNTWFVAANILNSYLFAENARQTTVANYSTNDFATNTINNSQKQVSYAEQKQMKNILQFCTALQIQVGYERNISKHFSYQIEPFFRLSLRGQTANDLRGYAAGLSLRMNYMR